MKEQWMVLKTEEQYNKALERTIEIFHAEPESAEFAELELLLVLVKDYEDKHFILPDPDPIEVIKMKMDEKGLKPKDLAEIIGSKSNVSLILSGKRELTLKMVRGLHKLLGIPSDILIAGSNKHDLY